MSNLFRRVPALAGAAHNNHHDSCRSPFFLSRGIMSAKPVTGIPALNAGNIAHPALQSIALFLIIAMSMVTMAKPAHASGNVQRTALWCSHESVPASCTYSTKEAACVAMAADNPLYNHNPKVVYSGGWFAGYSCYGQYMQTTNYYRLGWLVQRDACPANSTSTGATTCTCNGSYVADTTGTSCVAPVTACPANMSGSPCACNAGYVPGPYYATGCVAACPANMSGFPCACNTGYVPNPAGAGCLLVQYTLSLKTNPLEKIEPSVSATVIATVKDEQGNGKSGVTVSIKVDVDKTSGGHDHGESAAIRNKGALDAASRTTGPDGTATFTFSAPDASGTHTFTATCDSPTCTNSPVTARIDVKVDGLSAIPGSEFYSFIGDNGNHSGNHYLTPEAASVLWRMAVSYHMEAKYQQSRILRRGRLSWAVYSPPLPLQVNDASLIWGGRFDVMGNWATPHAGHRRGVVIDVRANSNTGAIPLASFANFQDMAASYKNATNGKGAEAQVHCTSNKTDGQNRQPPNCIGRDRSQDSNRHMHILLLGVDQ